MEKQKNNNGLIVLVIVLFLLVLGLGGYIVYDKALNNNETLKKDVSNNETVEEEKLPEWAEYLLNQNITEIKVFNRLQPSDGVNCLEPENITKEQFTSIITEMVKSDLANYKNASGFGGPCMKDLIVKYNDDQEFKLLLFKYIVTNDDNIVSSLTKEKYTENTSMQGDDQYEDLYAYEWDTSYLDTLLG